MHVGLGQLAEAPTQTVERLDKALKTLGRIERVACDQHDHASFANVLDAGTSTRCACPGLRLQAGATVGDGTAATAPRTRAPTDDVDIAFWMCL